MSTISPLSTRPSLNRNQLSLTSALWYGLLRQSIMPFHWRSTCVLCVYIKGEYLQVSGSDPIYPRCPCGVRVKVLGLCVSVSSNLPSRAITRPTRYTNSIRVTWAVKKHFLYNFFG